MDFKSGGTTKERKKLQGNVARNVENAARAVQHNATPHCSCRSLVDQLQDFVGAVNDNLLEVLQCDNAQQYEYTNFDRIQSVYVYIMLYYIIVHCIFLCYNYHILCYYILS